MPYRQITGQYKHFYDDEPFSFGKVIIELDKSDYDTNAIYPVEKREIILDQNGNLPIGFTLFINTASGTGSNYNFTDPDGAKWRAAVPAGASAIDIEDLRASGTPM